MAVAKLCFEHISPHSHINIYFVIVPPSSGASSSSIYCSSSLPTTVAGDTMGIELKNDKFPYTQIELNGE